MVLQCRSPFALNVQGHDDGHSGGARLTDAALVAGGLGSRSKFHDVHAVRSSSLVFRVVFSKKSLDVRHRLRVLV